jgi:hypothetical protein
MEIIVFIFILFVLKAMVSNKGNSDSGSGKRSYEERPKCRHCKQQHVRRSGDLCYSCSSNDRAADLESYNYRHHGSSDGR